MAISAAMPIDIAAWLRHPGGGLLIGFSAVMPIGLNGRIAGVAGVPGALLASRRLKSSRSVANADPYRLGQNDSEWAAIMNGRQAAREVLMKPGLRYQRAAGMHACAPPYLAAFEPINLHGSPGSGHGSPGPLFACSRGHSSSRSVIK